jgi:hypothetical protein
MLDDQGAEFYTTNTCVSIVKQNGITEVKWLNAYNAWIDRTYVPAFVFIESGYGGKKAYSKAKGSILVRCMHTQATNSVAESFWLSKKHCHPGDWNSLLSAGVSKLVSVRIPKWLAKRRKITGYV